MQQVLRTYWQFSSVEEAAEYLSISPWQVNLVLAFYAEFKSDVDSWIKEDQEYADRAYAQWLREQELVAK